MTKLILIRPGATDYDDQERLQGTLSIPLNERGRAEVERLIEHLHDLPIAALYSAPGEPAMATAQALADALGVKVRTIEELRNVDCGLWQGLQIDEVRRKHPRVFRQWRESPETVCPPGGETWSEARCRAIKAVESLVRKHRDETVALVLCDPLERIVRRALEHESADEAWKSRSEEPWTTVEVAAEELRAAAQ